MHLPYSRVYVCGSFGRRLDKDLVNNDTPVRHEHRKKVLRKIVSHISDVAVRSGTELFVSADGLDDSDEFDPFVSIGMQTCDAAVVLLDLDALDSRQVLREVTVLWWRRWTCGIALIPAMVGTLTEKELENNPVWSSVGLSKLELLKPPTSKLNNTTARNISEQVILKLASGGDDDQVQSAVQRWVEDFTEFTASVSDNRLKWAAQKLGFSDANWIAVRHKREALGNALLGADSARALSALKQLFHVLRDVDARREVAKRAYPLWVDLDAACVIADASMLAPDDRLLGISTTEIDLAEHIILRATCQAPEHAIVRSSDVTGEEPVKELLDRYVTDLRKLLNLAPDDSIDEIAQDLASLDGIIFALLRLENLRPSSAKAVLEQLRMMFPGVVFVVLARSSNGIWKRIKFHHAYTSLDRAQEKAAKRYLRRTANLIGEVSDDDGNE